MGEYHGSNLFDFDKTGVDMYRCSANALSQGPRRVLRSKAGIDRGAGVEDMALKFGACALHLDDASIPKTASLSSHSIGGSAASDDEQCPVTGRLSNILDDYVVFPKVLGEGNYGCVQECKSRVTWRTFACKSIEKSKVRRLDHLRNEVRLLSELDHRGIVRMVDCYEDADHVHVVTEKCTGGELYDMVVDRTTPSGCFSEHEAACIAKQLLEAVAYLHEHDVIHRDIKPENILFQSRVERVLKLIDFGLAVQHHDGDACVDDPVGTSYYMSPEVLRGEYEKSCDMWAVGVLLYILLSGHPPFGGDTDPEVFEAIRFGKLEFPARQWRSKSEDAKKLIRGLLRRDPRRRLTAGEALRHPWIRSLDGEREKGRSERKRSGRLRYLQIP